MALPLLPIVLLAGAGGYIWYRSTHGGFGGSPTPPPTQGPPISSQLPFALDPGLSDFNRNEVANLLYYENDPVKLAATAEAYQRNGFPMSAAALSAKAHGTAIVAPH